MTTDRDPLAHHLTALRDLAADGVRHLPPAHRAGLVAVIDGHAQSLAQAVRDLRLTSNATSNAAPAKTPKV